MTFHRASFRLVSDRYLALPNLRWLLDDSTLHGSRRVCKRGRVAFKIQCGAVSSAPMNRGGLKPGSWKRKIVEPLFRSIRCLLFRRLAEP